MRRETHRFRPAALAACSVLVAASLVLLPGAVAPALGDQESATATIEMTPRGGTLYREAPRPVNWRVEAEIAAPLAVPLILPMKRIDVSFPIEMSFNPDPDMPVCPDNKVGPPPVNLSVPPETIIARCPRSVLGNGTSEVYLARMNTTGAPNLLDPVLVIFNAGRNRDGSPRIKVYGFSAALATGIYLEGTLRRNLLVVDIAQLPVDSAVGRFDLNIPGAESPFPERRGRDPEFVRATCADGFWDASASFTLGTRDTGGNPTSPDSIVAAPPVVVPCAGAVGKPRLRIQRAVPVRRGAVYAVKVRNTGTASATGYRLRVLLLGPDRTIALKRLRPGAATTLTVPTRGNKPRLRLLPPS